jgi:CheY-like chemotaxis protein/HPt (histidine-containing phosphotransfer) domain-containing protein
MFELKETSFGLNTLIETTASGLADRASAREVEVIAFSSASIPDRIRADSRVIRRILTCLGRFTIDNAGGQEVVFYAEADRSAPAAPQVRFFISGLRTDIFPEGQSITLEELLHIDIAQESMNLIAARQLACIISSGLQLVTSPAKGTVFTFAIPLVEAPASGFKAAAGLTGSRILVVDDNPISRQALQGLLEALGCRVKTVGNGIDVLPALVRGLLSNSTFRLVLLDQEMPGLKGKDVLAAIRAHETAKDTRVVMMVPHGQAEESLEGYGKDISGILEKPIRRIQLRETIEYALGLRLDTPHNQKLPKPVQPVEKPPVIELQRKFKILMAEDDIFSQKIASILLERLGLSVEMAFNGAEALQAVRARDFDLVLMDMHMPIMTGLESAKEIRKLGGDRGNIPIFAMTASELDDAENRCKEAGMDGYLSKPLDMKRISQVITSCLEKDYRQKPIHARSGKTGPLIAEAPLLDIPAVLPIFDNDYERYKRFLVEFLQGFSTRQKSLETSFANKTWETLEREAHTIKGVAASLGAMKLARLAASLENQAKKMQPDSIITINNIHDMIGRLIEKAKDQVPAIII